MVQNKTLLFVMDNTGIKTVRCINNLKKNKYVLVSVFEKKSKSFFKKGNLLLALLIKNKRLQTKKNGISFIFQKNAVILINSKKCLIGTRFFGPIPSNFRRNKLLKILCLTLTII